MHQEQPMNALDSRLVKTLPFVEALARRMAASMPHSIDIGDLVQDVIAKTGEAVRVRRFVRFELGS